MKKPIFALSGLILLLSAALTVAYATMPDVTLTDVTLPSVTMTDMTAPDSEDAVLNETVAGGYGYKQLYTEAGLDDLVAFRAFEEAMTGYDRVRSRGKDILVLIDFTKPSSQERMYVIDVPHRKLLFHTHVAHGQGSGTRFATSFSNVPGSHQSSLGFYVTESTYQGKNGYSLILHGLEKGINDKARERSIVIHGAPYCNPEIIASSGRLGRSHGCPALPPQVSKDVIDTIKDGALIYIYAADRDYASKSPILSPHN